MRHSAPITAWIVCVFAAVSCFDDIPEPIAADVCPAGEGTVPECGSCQGATCTPGASCLAAECPSDVLALSSEATCIGGVSIASTNGCTCRVGCADLCDGVGAVAQGDAGGLVERPIVVGNSGKLGVFVRYRGTAFGVAAFRSPGQGVGAEATVGASPDPDVFVTRVIDGLVDLETASVIPNSVRVLASGQSRVEIDCLVPFVH